MKEGFIN